MNQQQEAKILSFFKNKNSPREEKNLPGKVIEFLEKKDSKNVEKAIEIGEYLFLKKFNKETLFAGLLFLDYEKKDEKEIKELFGEEVCDCLSDYLKLKEIASKEKNELTRELILSSVESIGAIILELVFKLIELRNSENKTLAKEIMENDVPLANRLGLERIKKDLVDISFKIINPRKYEEISRFLKMSENERESYIKKIINEFENELKKEIKHFRIKGREKQIFSMYEKIINQKIPLDKQKDQFGIRIITQNEEECYKIFEIIERKYQLLGDTVKDYIKNQKENGYQSIHLCIKKDEKIIEIQLRTEKMDELAEEGTASHWMYKKMKGNTKFEKKTAWFREILKLKQKKSSLFEGIKINLFKDVIYCYTPLGKMISLSSGATALDFAYSIHAEIGNHAVGALVNKKYLPLKTPVQNGDTIEIITNKFQRPRRDWLKFVKTKYAKKIISREIKRIENIPVPKGVVVEKNKDEGIETLATIPEFPRHLINFAKCCNPLPGDEIVGVLKSYKRALIHKKSCERIGELKKNELNAEWKEILTKPTKIFAETSDRSGILADIINTISRKGFKIKEANAKLIGNGFAECYFVVIVDTIQNVEEIVKRMKKINGMKKIRLD